MEEYKYFNFKVKKNNSNLKLYTDRKIVLERLNLMINLTKKQIDLILPKIEESLNKYDYFKVLSGLFWSTINKSSS